MPGTLPTTSTRQTRPGRSSAAPDTLNRRIYPLQNWRADVVAVYDLNEGVIAERVRYSAYGVPFCVSAADFDADGDVDAADNTAYSNANTAGDASADLNLDGVVDFNDTLAWNNLYNAGETGGRSVLSRSSVRNRIGYAGYQHDPSITGSGQASGQSKYHVRVRVYDAGVGRWTRRDPLGYVDGMSVYEYVGSAPVVAVDSQGLQGGVPDPCTNGRWMPRVFPYQQRGETLPRVTVDHLGPFTVDGPHTYYGSFWSDYARTDLAPRAVSKQWDYFWILEARTLASIYRWRAKWWQWLGPGSLYAIAIANAVQALDSTHEAVAWDAVGIECYWDGLSPYVGKPRSVSPTISGPGGTPAISIAIPYGQIGAAVTFGPDGPLQWVQTEPSGRGEWIMVKSALTHFAYTSRRTTSKSIGISLEIGARPGGGGGAGFTSSVQISGASWSTARSMQAAWFCQCEDYRGRRILPPVTRSMTGIGE